MSTQSLKEKLIDLDRLIQAGKADEVHRELRLLLQKKMPREEVARVANLARRIYAPGLALRLLNPIVRPSGRKAIPATDAEKAEYAASLTQVGAAEEATVLLEQISAEKLPQVLLFEAFSLFSQWNYASAIPLLEKYLKVEGLNDYQRLVGRVNLASAFLNERRTEEAQRLLRDLLKVTKEQGLHLLQGNVLEMSAQAAILRKEFGEAERLLAEGKSVLTNDKSLPAFLIHKWAVILEVVKTNGSKRSIEALRRLKAESLGIHEETSRDCDRYEAIFTGNEKLFRHLYFGTPFKSFRDRLLADFRGAAAPALYDWELGVGADKQKVLDIFGGGVVGEKARLKRGQLSHRLLMALGSDFYIPIRMAALHHKLYPNEYYNPVSSPHQVHEAIRKLRKWFTVAGLPLAIEEKKSFYRLVALAACTLRVHRPDEQAANPSKEVFFVDLLHRTFPDGSFQAGEASQILNLPLRSTQRLLSKLHEEQVLSRSGEARAIRYSFENKKAA